MAAPVLPILAGGGLLMKFISVAFIVGLIARVIAALGLGFFAFTGLDQGLDSIQAAINTNLTGMPFEVKQLLDMAGITTILFWILNAHAFKVFVSVAKFSLFRRKSFIT